VTREKGRISKTTGNLTAPSEVKGKGGDSIILKIGRVIRGIHEGGREDFKNKGNGREIKERGKSSPIFGRRYESIRRIDTINLGKS